MKERENKRNVSICLPGSMLYIIVGTLCSFASLEILLSETRVCGGKIQMANRATISNSIKSSLDIGYIIYIYICNVGTTTAGPDVMTNVLVQNYKMRERKNMLLIIKALLKGP